jgi:hypothetical protein
LRIHVLREHRKRLSHTVRQASALLTEAVEINKVNELWRLNPGDDITDIKKEALRRLAVARENTAQFKRKLIALIPN